VDTSTLTAREREVLTLLAYGHTNDEVAEQLTISVRTAEMHRANAMRKLQVRSRAEIVRWALAEKLLA
jgi:two-component system, NarL family, response regulator NreC